MIDYEIVPTYADLGRALAITPGDITFILVKNDEHLGLTNTLYISFPNATTISLSAITGGNGGSFSGDAAQLTGTLPDAVLSTNVALKAYVNTAVANLVNSSPAALDTLKELADALGDDPNFATTITNALAGKVNTSDIVNALTQVATGKVLDASQGKVLNDLILANTTNIVANTTNITGNTTNLAALNYPAAEAVNGVYFPVLKASALSGSTGLADHASGGIVAAVAGTAGSGDIYLPRPIDPTKPWRCAVLIEINDSQPITNLQFTDAAGDFWVGARITSANTTSMASDWAGGTTFLSSYGNTGGIPAGTKMWFGMASDGSSNVNVFLIPYTMPLEFLFNSVPAFGIAWTGFAYNKYLSITTTYATNSNNVFGGTGAQAQYRLCRFSIANKSTTNRIIGMYWAQSLNGPKDGQLNPPFMMRNAILQDTSAWIICPGTQGSQPTDIIMMPHPNASDEYSHLIDSRCNELSKLYAAGYLMSGILGSYNNAGYSDATASNWGAAAGLVYRKKQLDWIRNNIPLTRHLFILGQSMGCLNALQFNVQYPGVVKAIAGVSGVTDLSDSYSNRGFSSIIQKALGAWYVNIQAITGLDPSLVVTTTGTNAVSATSITVSALASAIPSGTTLTLQSGTGQTTVVTTASAAASATSISVTALTVQISAGAKYNMAAYWTAISYGNGAPDESYYVSPFVWRDAYAAATAYSINDIVYKQSALTVGQVAYLDPRKNPYAFKNLPIKLWHGDADTTIPSSQATNFQTDINAVGGNVQVVIVSGGTHIGTTMYDGTAIVNFFNSNK